jgi:hypothetical protein
MPQGRVSQVGGERTLEGSHGFRHDGQNGDGGLFFFFFLVVLESELRAYTLSHSTSPFFEESFFLNRVS